MVKQFVYTRRYRIKLMVIGSVCFLVCLHTSLAMFLLTRYTTPAPIYLFLSFLILITLIGSIKIFVAVTRRITLDDRQILFTSFFHHDRSILWKDICEIGAGRVFSPDGIRYCIFLSTGTLSDREINNLDLASGKCFYFARLSEDMLKQIEAHLPIAVPENIYRWVIKASEKDSRRNGSTKPRRG